MRKFAAVTTFHKEGLDLYGQNFIDSFCLNMPQEVDLYIYAEECNPVLPENHKRKIKIIKVEDKLDKLNKFKHKYSNDPKAIGDRQFVENLFNTESFKDKIKRFIRFKKKKRKIVKDEQLFMWNAVRFSHKVYATLDAARISKCDILMWIDADNVVHGKVPMEFLDNFIPEDVFSCYLGRKKLYTETGWYSMNLNYPNASKFFAEYERMYEDAEEGIFKLSAWTDCHAYDASREFCEKKFGFVNKNISSNFAEHIHHPLINSELGAYFDHLKGKRKHTGKSKPSDIQIDRQESYWQ